MPLYMDLHIIPGVRAEDVARAHREDLLIEKDHHCKCMTYWIDETRGHIFCLIEAPHKEAVIEMHRNSHGLVPHKIIEVQPGVVESFLGRISDPEDAEETEEGLKLIKESSYRTILVAHIKDPVLLKHELGIEKANEVMEKNYDAVNSALKRFGGKETDHRGSAFVASFTSASLAISAATSILESASGTFPAGIKIAIHSGEPFSKAENIFDETIRLADMMCFIINETELCISSAVKEIFQKEHLGNNPYRVRSLSKADEEFLEKLFEILELNWQDSDFNVEDYAQKMTMSQSQLYRKIVALAGFTPNILLKEYRLDKARKELRKRSSNVSQVTFNAGFSSPSYFTKCFKKKFGMLPLSYLEKQN